MVLGLREEPQLRRPPAGSAHMFLGLKWLKPVTPGPMLRQVDASCGAVGRTPPSTRIPGSREAWSPLSMLFNDSRSSEARGGCRHPPPVSMETV